MLLIEENFIRSLRKAKRRIFLLEFIKDYNRTGSKFEFYRDTKRNEAGLKVSIPSKIWIFGKKRNVRATISRNAMIFIIELVLSLLNEKKRNFSLLIKENKTKAWEIPHFDKDLSLSMMIQEIARYQRLLKPIHKKNPIQALVERLP